MPGLAFPQEPQHPPAPYREAGRVVLSGLLGCDVADDMLRKLVGPDPTTVDQLQTNRYFNDYDRGDKDPIPKWNGTNTAKLSEAMASRPSPMACRNRSAQPQAWLEVVPQLRSRFVDEARS